MRSERESLQRFTEPVLGTALFDETLNSPEHPYRRRSKDARTELGRLAMRGVSKAREIMSTTSLQLGYDRSKWLPARELLEQTMPNFEAIGRRLAMINNLEKYIVGYKSEQFDSGLYSYQQHSLENVLKFYLSDVLNPDAADQQDLLALLTKKGYLDLPTAYGKTVLMIKLCEAMGIGSKPTEHDSRRLRALVLVPSTNILKQTVGKDGGKGFGGIAPQLNTTSVSSRAELNTGADGDIVAMTYQMLHEKMKSDNFDHSIFDLVLCDESHHGLGAEIGQTVKNVAHGKTTIGFTATAEYPDGREVADLMPTLIEKMPLMDAIEDGVVGGVQIMWFASDEEIKVKDFSRNSGFNEEELKPLAASKIRNVQIEKLVKMFVAQGRRGVVSCIPGNLCEHATMLAARLDGTEVIDEVTGETRSIRAKAVGNFQTSEKNDETIEEYNNGTLDVVLYVDLLNEGWDCDEVNFMVLARPTTNRLAIQRFGRGLRKSKRWPVTVYAEIVDQIVSKTSKLPFTLRDILSSSTRRPRLGEVFKEKVSKQPVRTKQDSTEALPEETYHEKRNQIVPLENLPPDLAESCEKAENILVYHATARERDQYDLPPPGWVALDELVHYGGGRSEKEIQAMLSDKYRKGRFQSPNGRTRYYEPLAKEYLMSLPPLSEADLSPQPGELTLTRFSKKSGYTTTLIKAHALELAIPLEGRNRQTSRGSHHHITTDEQTRITERIEENEMASSSDVPVEEVSQVLGLTHPESVYIWLNKLGIAAKRKIPYYPEKGASLPAKLRVSVWHITAEEAEFAITEFHRIPIAGPAHYTLSGLIVEAGMSNQNIKSLMEELGVKENFSMHIYFTEDQRIAFGNFLPSGDGLAVIAEAKRRKQN